MKIKFVGACREYAAGDVAEVDKARAVRLIAAGVAVPAPKKQVERAVKSAPESRAK